MSQLINPRETAGAAGVRFLRCALAAFLLMGFAPAQETNTAPSTTTTPALWNNPAGVPRLINFSGTLKDASGNVPNGNVTVVFSLYAEQEGGSPLWSETQTVKPNSRGYYSIFLGVTQPDGLPQELFTSTQAHWLGAEPMLPGVGELPRVLLVGVPYALKAGDAETLGGKPASAFLTADSLREYGTVNSAATQNVPGPGVASGAVSPNPDTTKVPLLNAPNTFNPSQSVSGDLSVSGTVEVDSTGANTGTDLPGIQFGASNSGETISSKRNSGGNQFGLDFYTAYNVRMSLTNSGSLGIGTTAPAALLDVEGTPAQGGANAVPALQIVGGAGGGPVPGNAGNGGGVTVTGGSGGVGDVGGVGGGLTVTLGPGGGGGANGGNGGGITMTAGAGGEGGGNGGNGAGITLTAGAGGQGGGTNGNGGGITLQPGMAGKGGPGAGSNGNLLLAPNGGLVGIGTSTPHHTLEVTVGGSTLADKWTTRSSRRWKTNIQTLDGALEKVEKLRGVSYDLKANGQHQIGVIAEEVGAVVPEIVEWDNNGKDANGVEYSRLTALLIEAVKQQQSEIREQQDSLAKAQQVIQRQQAELASVRRELGREREMLRTQSTAVRDLKLEIRSTQQVNTQLVAGNAASITAK